MYISNLISIQILNYLIEGYKSLLCVLIVIGCMYVNFFFYLFIDIILFYFIYIIVYYLLWFYSSHDNFIMFDIITKILR